MGEKYIRGKRGRGVAGASRMDGAVVSQSSAVQGVRGEERPGADSLLRRFCLLLQPPPARASRDRAFRALERVSAASLP